MRALGVVAVGLVLTGCGGNLSQAAARDFATSRYCDWHQKCGNVGSGKQFANRDACEIDSRKYWNDNWPVATCDGKIVPSDLDVCLKAIDSTICGNGFDLLNTLLNKCSRSQVCKG